MKQEKLSFQAADAGPVAKEQFAHLDLLPHSVYVCNERTRILWRNRHAAEEFVPIRIGTLFSRFCEDWKPSDGVLAIRTLLGFRRFLICRYLQDGLFEVEIPGGFVMSDSAMPEQSRAIRILSDHTRLLAERLKEGGIKGRRIAAETGKLADLGELLKRCLDDLSMDAGVDRNMTVCISDLLYSIRRRSAQALAGTDAFFDYDCPREYLCSAAISSTVFILLNLICFLRIYLGQKRITARVESQEESTLIRFRVPSAAPSPASFYAGLFRPGHQREMEDSLLTAPFTLALAAAGRCGYDLDCVYGKKETVLTLRLPLQKGSPDLTVLRPGGLASDRDIKPLQAFLEATLE